MFIKVLVQVGAGVMGGEEQCPRAVMHHAHPGSHYAHTPTPSGTHTTRSSHPRHTHHHLSLFGWKGEWVCGVGWGGEGRGFGWIKGEWVAFRVNIGWKRGHIHPFPILTLFFHTFHFLSFSFTLSSLPLSFTVYRHYQLLLFIFLYLKIVRP